MTTQYSVYQANNDALPANVVDGFQKRDATNATWEQVGYGAVGAIQAVGTAAAAGTADNPARADHVHALSFSTVNGILLTANASINVNSQTVTGLAAPSSSSDAATKGYVDSVALADVDKVANGSLQTTDATANQVLATLPTSSNTLLKVMARVGARRSDVGGTGYGATLDGTFLNNAGTLTQIGVTAAVDTQLSVGVLASATFAVSGTSVNVVVTGEAAKTYQWRANMSAAVTA